MLGFSPLGDEPVFGSLCGLSGDRVESECFLITKNPRFSRIIDKVSDLAVARSMAPIAHQHNVVADL